QFLFSVLNLPFLPTYNDTQFKYKHRLNEKSQLTILGIGAYDDFVLNLNAPDKISDEASREEAQYILNFLPVSKQWNYTLGAKYEYFRKNGTTAVILSNNQLNNTATKYRDNDDSDEQNLIQDYRSRESEVRLRIEDFSIVNKWRLSYGAIYTHSRYNTSDFNLIVSPQGPLTRNFSSLLDINQYGAFVQASTNVINDKGILSFGIRTDINDYSDAMRNPLEQLSPRISFSYALTEALSLNANAGIYYQLPPFTVLGYRNSLTEELENKTNGIRYIRSDHLVAGLEYRLPFNARVTVEGFYKKYTDYPFLLEDSVALANLGADFGVIGNAPASPDAEGRSYGLEFLYQQKLYKGFYALLAYTLVRSEFSDRDGNFIPSSWDNRNLVSFTGGKQLKKNWEIAARWLYSGGNPFTPFNIQETVRASNWDVRGFGIPDFSLLNTQRTSAYHQLDIRVDKKYFFPKWSLNFFLDIQNVYNFAVRLQDNIDVLRDAQGQAIPDPNNPDFYIPRTIQSTSGIILPTIGLIIEL
ncbi:MAG TPA: TonB-dependent receptor, partial [Cyclobacteriaceae bacterium]|nr:TonB-dependent receptor [Cyclobacteriaceae bacterium]